MAVNRLLVCLGVWAATAAVAQTAEVKLFHPDGPLPSYEVATIKPADPSSSNLMFRGTTVRRFIQSAYGAGALWGFGSDMPMVQVVGGPAWIDKEMYQINGKLPDELRAAMKTMPPDERKKQTEMMDQSLLAERFHLKSHIEVHEMTVYELVPAKGGLKLKPVDPPPADGPKLPAEGLNGQVVPGVMRLSVNQQGVRVLDAKATTMQKLIDMLRAQADIGARPIVDKSGFTGCFDVEGLRFSGQRLPSIGAGPPPQTATDPDAPAISTSLEETLGLKLVSTKAPVEVVVIDSIDRPTEN